MNITQLTISNFRNLRNMTLYPSSCNVFVGANGSGKTSLLESIYLLSRGKSFRHHQPKHYIAHGYPTTTVFAQLGATQAVAIEKSLDASTQLRLDGESVTTQSPLAQRLPTLLLEPATLSQLEQGSQARRELLDWLVFHVEQSFHGSWLSYQRLLRQRNSLLKRYQGHAELSVIQRHELQAWDNQLSAYAAAIHQARSVMIKRWQPYFEAQIQVFLPAYAHQLRLRYSAGFDVERGLGAMLSERLPMDRDLGYTRVGSHRADLNVVIDLVTTDEHGRAHKHTLPATDMLSRGEKKLLMMALRLSQLPLLNAVNKTPLVLIDDITAELDSTALSLLLSGLQALKSQLFITSLSDDMVTSLMAIWQEDVTVFHVKHGEVAPISLPISEAAWS